VLPPVELVWEVFPERVSGIVLGLFPKIPARGDEKWTVFCGVVGL